MAYLRKAVGVYLDQASKDAANVNTEKSQEEVDKLKANPNTINTAKEAVKTDVARKGNVEEQKQLTEIKKDYDKATADLDVDTKRKLADIQMLLEENSYRVRTNASKEMLDFSNRIQLELAKEVVAMNLPKKVIDTLAILVQAQNGTTSTQRFIGYINQGAEAVGNVVGAVKK